MKNALSVRMIRYEDFTDADSVIYLSPDDGKCEWEVISSSGASICSCKPCNFIAKGNNSKLSFREDDSNSNSICENIGLLVGPGCYARKVEG